MVIAGVVAPVDHVFPELADDVKVTDPPEQIVVEPLVVTVGAEGAPGEVKLSFNVLETHPVAVGVNVILYAPPPSELIEEGNVTVEDPEAAPDQFNVPDPDPLIAIDPSVAPQLDGLVNVPGVIAGIGFTVTVVPPDDGEVQEPEVVVTV